MLTIAPTPHLDKQARRKHVHDEIRRIRRKSFYVDKPRKSTLSLKILLTALQRGKITAEEAIAQLDHNMIRLNGWHRSLPTSREGVTLEPRLPVFVGDYTRRSAAGHASLVH